MQKKKKKQGTDQNTKPWKPERGREYLQRG